MHKNIIYLLIVQITNYVFPLITLPYLVRTLGVDNYGYLMLGQALIQYFILITDFGFNFSATKKIALSNNQHEINKIYTETINAKIILTFMCLFGLAVVLAIVPMYDHITMVCIILFLGVIGNSLFPIYLFQGLEKMKNITWITVVARSVMLGMIFLLVRDPSDINEAAFSLALALALPGLLSIILVHSWRLASYNGFSFQRGIKEIRESSPLFISQIAISFYTIFNIILIGHMFDARQVGIYSAADKLRGAVQSFFVPIQQVVFPRINKDSRSIFVKLRIYGGTFILLSFVICLMIFCIGEKVALWYLGPSFSESAKLFKWMSLVIFIVTISIVVSQWGLITLGKEKVLTKIYILGALLHCSYAPLVTSRYGISGMLGAVILTEIVLVTAMVILLIRYIMIKREL